ncbi:YagK/YfjJ domain-containing protein [Aeromonas rivipollensis]|uniref:YagK/YfjJ domain-containing protein n=1 Tax=Aeromonas rivipollensis TaxID=948519 RepID=UPI003D216049
MMLVDNLPSAVVAKVRGKAKRKQGKRYGHVTYQSVYIYQGVNYPINTTSASGCYTKPLSEMIRRIKEAVTCYRRVLFVRLDLSMGEGEATSERLSAFLKQAGRYVTREHGTRLEYVWCREQEKAKRQHYHLAILIDGDKLRHPARLYEELAEIWQRKGGRISIPENGYLMTDSHNIAEAVYRISYLAKERGKGYRPDGVRDFGYSQIKQSIRFE